MATGTTTGFDDASQVTDVKPDLREKLGGFLKSGVEGGQMQAFLDKHHAQRLEEARMHKQNLVTSAAALKMINDGIDPETHTRFDDAGYKGEGKDQLTLRYNTAHNFARQNLEKLVQTTGNKEGKGALQKTWAVLDHLIRGGGQQAQPQPSAAAASTAPQTPAAQTPPPAGPSAITPQGTATSSGGFPITGAGGPRMTPPPAPPDTTPPKAEGRGPAAAPSTGGQADDDTTLLLPVLRKRMEADEAGDRSFRDYERKQRLTYQLKTEEDAAKAKAQASAKATSTPRPVPLRPIGVRDALDLQAANPDMEFLDENDKPIELDKVPPGMELVPYITKDVDENGKAKWVTKYSFHSPNQRFVTIGGERIAMPPQDMTRAATTPGVATNLGPGNIPTTTSATDPATGQTTVTTHTPRVTGMGGGLPPAPSATAPTSPTGATPKGAAKQTPSATTTGGSKTRSTPSASVLASDGTHIDSNAVGKPFHGGVITPQIIEAANQLIDDRDVDKIPTKVRELGAALAREQAGWFQGKFTPMEETRLDEAETFIRKLRDDDKALAVLDSGAWNRYWVGKAKEKHTQGTGMFSNIGADIENYIRTREATKLTPNESAFSVKYDQAAQIVAGLAQLIRSGRATNSQVDTIRNELPNVFNTRNAAEAKQRLNNLLKEVEIARRSGTVRREGTRKGMTPPPGDGSSKSIDERLNEALDAASKAH